MFTSFFQKKKKKAFLERSNVGTNFLPLKLEHNKNDSALIYCVIYSYYEL